LSVHSATSISFGLATSSFSCSWESWEITASRGALRRTSSENSSAARSHTASRRDSVNSRRANMRFTLASLMRSPRATVA
jgi:hypothetical protein